MQGEARQIVREGIVSAVYPQTHSARVCFQDKDNLISANLPVLTTCAYKNKSYSLPDVGESVVCLFATNDEDGGSGFIIGSRFHDKSQPVESSQDISRLDFGDGTFIRYDRKTHELKIKCVGKIFIDGKEIHLNDGG